MTSQKIQTSYGVVTIFKNKPDIKEKKSNDKIKKEINEPVTEKSKAINQINKDENFFGLENENDQNKDLNFIDQQLLNGYKTDSITNNSINEKISESIDEKDLNFIDDHYFSKNVNSDISGSENITKKEIEKMNDLNFIDKMTFHETKQVDNMLGSIIDFKDKINNNPDTSKNYSEDTIPLVTSNKLNQENSMKFRNILNENKLKGLKRESLHKTLDSEVPKWKYLTIDEASLILKNHICYINEEGFKFIFIK